MGETSEANGRDVDLFDRRWVRVGLFAVIPAALFLLVCAGIRVSQYGIDHTILVTGQRDLVRGWPAALRLTLIADDGEYLLPSRVDGALVRGEVRHRLFEAAGPSTGYALGCNFAVPDLTPGPAVLELDIRFGERRRTVRANVEIVGTPPDVALTIPADAQAPDRPAQVWVGATRVQAFTEDRAAPTGFTSVAFLRATDAEGAPVRADLDLSLLGDEDGSRRRSTDALGLLGLPVRPVGLDLSIPVAGSRWSPPADRPDAGASADAGPGSTGDAALYLPSAFAGISAALHSPVVDRRENVRITAHHISAGGFAYADLFSEGRWVHTASAAFEGRRARLEFRSPVTGIARVQVSTSPFMPGNAVAVRHLYALDEAEDLNDGLRAAAERLRDLPVHRGWADAVLRAPLERGGAFDRTLAAAFALSRLYEGHQEIPQIVSSRKEDDAELGEFKQRFQRSLMLIIMVIGVCVALIIGTIALQSQRRSARITKMIMDEAGDEAPEQRWRTDVGRATARRRLVFQGVVLLIIVVGAFAAIALLVATLTWSR